MAASTLTSTISLLEVIVAYMVEEFNFKRHKVIVYVSLGILFLGVLSSLSLGTWSDVTIFGMGFFNLFDNATSKVLMPLGGLLISVFVGWMLDKNAVLNEMSNAGKLKVGYFKLYLFLVRYLAPIAIIVTGKQIGRAHV